MPAPAPSLLEEAPLYEPGFDPNSSEIVQTRIRRQQPSNKPEMESKNVSFSTGNKQSILAPAKMTFNAFYGIFRFFRLRPRSASIFRVPRGCEAKIAQACSRQVWRSFLWQEIHCLYQFESLIKARDLGHDSKFCGYILYLKGK